MSDTGKATLLVELGCEEIPDRMVDGARRDLTAAIISMLTSHRLLGNPDASNPCAFSTPRRLAVKVDDVLVRQPDETVEVTGPPVAAAFDDHGAPTRAATGFAASQGVGVEALRRVPGPKGEVVAVSRTNRGRDTAAVLADELPGAVLGLTFPKMMAWGDGGIEFVRPVRWVVALHGERSLDVEIAGISSGRRTWPRRGSGLDPLTLRAAEDYPDVLEGLQVHPDPDARARETARAIDQAAAAAGGAVVPDPELENIVLNLVEYPGCLTGAFPESYLELPEEVLKTTLRHHQRCFSVVDGDGRLLPCFIAVVNVPEDRTGAIRRGYERVIQGRLDDARFFYREDRKQSLEARVESLQRLRFHAELGTFAGKAERMARLVGELSRLGDVNVDVADRAARAATLAKCDLATLMENEFPELQGVVGGLYAREDGEPEPVWQAIYDHYRPESVDDALPRGLEGCLVAAADRLDNLVGLMGTGIVPKGARDPFALRRAALGLVRLMVEKPLLFPLTEAVHAAAAGYHESGVELSLAPEELSRRVMTFLEGRLRFLFEQRGHRYDSIAAVLAAGWENPSRAAARLEALTAIRGQEDFEALAAASKRIRNILAQAAERGESPGQVDIDPGLFEKKAEEQLHGAAMAAASRVDAAESANDHRGALAAIADLRPQVDGFFDDVMVLTEEPGPRLNRLALLSSVADLYRGLADFAEIVVEGKP